MKCSGDLRRKLPPTIAFVAALSGCASVFGIDDPTACPNGVCGAPEEASAPPVLDATIPDSAEAAIDATMVGDGDEDSGGDAIAVDGPVDAPPDQAPATGVRCGSSGLRCSGATPICCEVVGDGGGKYGCVVSSASCSSPAYYIECATSSDCLHSATGHACCHFNSHIGCDPPSVCPTALVCDPDVGGSCEAGQSCNVAVAIGGYPSPYLVCGP